MEFFRVIEASNESIANVETVEAIHETVRTAGPGRYHIDEISRHGLASGHTAQRWGVTIMHADGSVVLDPDHWPKNG